MSMQTCDSAEQGGEAPLTGVEEPLTIHVRDDWGDGRRQDIQVLLANVASHITRHLRDSLSPVIEVWRRSSGSPMIAYRQPGHSTYTVLLSTTGTYWAQYSFQFAHEFCHLLSDYERLAVGGSNAWFHESLCELASLFTLRSMAVTWETEPPYPNWTAYAPALSDYVDGRLATVSAALPDADFVSWLRSHELEGRKNPYLREGNLIVALRMLPVFERHPQGWNALRRLPASNARIDLYLAQWKEQVDSCDRRFVGQIQEVLGTRVPKRTD